MNENKATVPISGRVAEEEYQFLMSYPISGKVTASEKLRYVVSFFRSYHESLDTYENCLAELNRLLEPSRKQIKKAEVEVEVSSEMVDRLMQVLPEIMASIVTAKIPNEGEKQLPSLLALEERMLKSLIGIVESLLRFGLTSQSPTYNPTLLKDRMNGVRELVELGFKK
ncbi:hypothetical protein MLD52_01395 [Puniceicoccaceae bacterium K14]|nr:hypothetical protein [Puniceicoccaceae bacterium K14]